MKQNTYQSQDRGTEKDYRKYLAAMDSVSVEKVASASVFFDPAPGKIIVDIGMASGTSSNILAFLFPQLKIIGVDINPTMVEIASKNYALPNLEFRVDDGELLKTFNENSISGFFNCSSIHHITSFNNYESYRAYNTIKRQKELLSEGGIIVVRDFVKPPEQEVIIDLTNVEHKNTPGDADLLIDFSKRARSLSDPVERGFPIKEIISAKKNIRRFRLFYADAVEFIRRKDYFENWEVELQEEYGYFTQKEFEEIFAGLGLRIIVSNPIYNPWIIRNRYKNKFVVYDLSLKDLGFPPTNYLIAAEKINKKGSSMHLIRHLHETEQSFLSYKSYENVESGKIYDVVQRPNSVIDILPYSFENGKLEILAKHGYPRPLANINAGNPIIDQKHFSGYITEGITASFNQSIEKILAERTGLTINSFGSLNHSLEFFTSPGGIEEKVESYFVEFKETLHLENNGIGNLSGFKNSGSIRKFNAIQLLKTAQTGALVEARLELSIYSLLRKQNISFPEWIGEKIEITDLAINESSLQDLLSESSTPFKNSEKSMNFLQKSRAKFSESGITESSTILEYVTPQNKSINTLVTLPVALHNNEYYIGLEIRELPVPQLITGNSRLIVASAFRLPFEVSTFKELENYMLKLNFFGSRIKSFNRLGEKYFPSIGVTPEQVYPYVVNLKTPTKGLKWIRLTELYENLEMIKDGHLLIAVMRLVNALQK
jgi:ubiquinone/menaquinone biosynthesis C-methylase UbiE